MSEITIRPISASDDLVAITALLHRAYAPLAAAGMRFLASHQDVGVTRERCFGVGVDCFVAEAAGEVVGTVSLQGPQPCPECPFYERPGVGVVNQLCVRPDLQRRGVGRRLIGRAEEQARRRGFAELACDTSEHAEHLIAWYVRLGFREVDRVRWSVTNYRSVVLSKGLGVGGGNV